MSVSAVLDLASGTAPGSGGGILGRLYHSTLGRLRFVDPSGNDTDVLNPPRTNYLINGDFGNCCRLATPTTLTQAISAGVINTYGGYVLDRWGIFCETLTSADVKAAQVDESAAGNAAFSMRVQNANAGTKRTATSQVLRYIDGVKMRGRKVTFQCLAKISTTARNLRCAIISAQSSSTKDLFTPAQKDVVNIWASTNYTTGNFFKATSGNWTYTLVGVSASFAATAAFLNTMSVSGTVPADCQNLICIVWDENGSPTTETFSIAQAGLFDGSIVRDWVQEDFDSAKLRCLPYAYAIQSDANNAVFMGIGAFSSTSQGVFCRPYLVQMRIKPVLLFNPIGSIGHVTLQNVSGGLSSAVTTITLSANSDSIAAFLQIVGTGTPYTQFQPAECLWNATGTADMLLFDAEI